MSVELSFARANHLNPQTESLEQEFKKQIYFLTSAPSVWDLVGIFRQNQIKAIPRNGYSCAVSQYLKKKLTEKVQLDPHQTLYINTDTSGISVKLGKSTFGNYGEITWGNASHSLSNVLKDFITEYDAYRFPELVDLRNSRISPWEATILTQTAKAVKEEEEVKGEATLKAYSPIQGMPVLSNA